MIPRVSIHTHTTFCDGRNTVEEMVCSAIEQKFDVIGFSGHSYIPGEDYWTMKKEGMEEYKKEVLRVRERYGDKIEILLGLEYDVLSDCDISEYEYIIGSVHFVKGKYGDIPVDLDLGMLRREVGESFGGDVYAFCEDYYRQLAGVCEKTSCDVVGHFDLLMKFNEDGSLFDENDVRYRRMALDCLDKLIKKDVIFEINTGAISRGYRTKPYPSRFILERMAELGAKITLTTDCHSTSALACYYDEAVEYARECGVRELYFPKNKKFVPYAI